MSGVLPRRMTQDIDFDVTTKDSDFLETHRKWGLQAGVAVFEAGDLQTWSPWSSAGARDI